MMTEIKLYGSGGHGLVVAAKLLADTAAKSGHQVQSFSSYGAARRGGRVESYIRISDHNVLLHSKVYAPDLLIIFDQSLIELTLTAGMQKGSTVLINSPQPPRAFPLLKGFKVFTVDADLISADKGLQLPSGIRIINTAMLGGMVALLPMVDFDHLVEAIRKGGIPQPEKNINAAQEAYTRVKAQVAGIGVAEAKEGVAQVTAERRPEYITKRNPCEVNCPAGEAIERTALLIQDGRFEEALQNIKAENPFPGVCGRLCFHPCETECNRKDYDRAITINALERAAYDYADTNKVAKPVKKQNTGKKVAVIGSGPAGMACAYFSALLGHNVTIFETSSVAGGIPRVAIPQYRLPKEVLDTEVKQILQLGVDLKTSTEVGKDISFADIMRRYDACFIATGAQRSLKLGITGEEGDGVFWGLDFLKGVSFGKSFSLGQKVVVIGGGNVAIDAARTARRLGSPEVKLVCLESRRIMPAYGAEVEAAEQEGIEIIYRAMPLQIHRQGKQVKQLECLQVRGGKRDKKGWLKWPEKITGTNFVVEADSIIVAIGAALDASFLPSAVEMDGGLIKADYLGRTSAKGVYAGGDATMRAGSVSDAIGSGKRAALGIDLFLNNGKGADEGKIVEAVSQGESGAISMSKYLAEDYTVEDKSVVRFADLNVNYCQKSPRAQIPELPLDRRVSGFGEVSLGLTRTEAMKQAERCLHCGHCSLCQNCYIFCPDIAIKFDPKLAAYTIDYEVCKTCGICIAECPGNVLSWRA